MLFRGPFLLPLLLFSLPLLTAQVKGPPLPTPPGMVSTAAFVTPSTAVRNPAGFHAKTLPANDDGSTGAVALGFTANFFGATTSTVFVNNNGNVTFTSSLSQYTPNGLAVGVGQ